MIKVAEDIKCINDVRNILDKFWQEAAAHGRCWGVIKGGSNPLAGSHIVLFHGDEMVTIYQGRGGGDFKLKNYREVKTTALGQKIKKHLAKIGVNF